MKKQKGMHFGLFCFFLLKQNEKDDFYLSTAKIDNYLSKAGILAMLRHHTAPS